MIARENHSYQLRLQEARRILGKDQEIVKKDEETGEEIVVKKKPAGKPITKEEATKLEYLAIVAEGRALYHGKEFRRAIEAFSNAMEKQKEDPSVLIDRANCYTRVGQPEDALRDIELVLRENAGHARAILAKAEAYFSMGEFEFALVFFQRGKAIRRDIVAFRDGVTKCTSAILDSINGIDPFQANPNFAASRPRDALVAVPPEARAPRERDPEVRGRTAALLPERVEPLAASASCTEFLGELALDFEYLLELREEVARAPRDDDHGRAEDAQIAAVVDDALAYLEQRGAFWSQQGGGGEDADAQPAEPAEDSTRQRAPRAKTAHYEMSKIQQYEAKYGVADAKAKSSHQSQRDSAE
jgi:tetratricopeptide (TPR) repeat protein